jgi:hypothetical protein
MEPVFRRVSKINEFSQTFVTAARSIRVSGLRPLNCVFRRDWNSDLGMTTVHRPMTKTAVLAAADNAVRLAGDARLPAGVMPFQINWPYVVVIGGYHAAALLAFMPGHFSWSGLIVAWSVPICADCLASTFAITGFSPTAA